MERLEALEIVKQKVFNQNLIKHCLAVDSIMSALADYFHQDGQAWALAGLLHDIDYEETKDDLSQHSLKGADFLQASGLSAEIVQAVKAHNGNHGLARETLMAQCLYATDPLSGLITASVLVMPSKRLADLSVESILKRFKEARFASGANRQAISSIIETGLNLGEFIKLGLEAMQKISNDLDL
jgi:uncharacterized protein